MNKVVEWYRKGIELGHSGCIMSLGFRYLYGESDLTPKDHKKAMELFQKSIEIDHRPCGYYGAGLVYYYGVDGGPDYKKRLNCSRRRRLGESKRQIILLAFAMSAGMVLRRISARQGHYVKRRRRKGVSQRRELWSD